MRYTILQIFLTDKRIGTLFEGAPSEGRQVFLKRIFGSERRFTHRKQVFVFKPYESQNKDVVVGVFAREKTLTISGSPSENFPAKEILDWETANVAVDTAGDVQTAAVHPTLGQPLAIFKSFADFVNNELSSEDWRMEVNPKNEEGRFWDVAAKFKGHIAEIDLVFVPPNIWGGQSATEIALKELHKDTKTDEVEVRIKNKEGKLEPEGGQRIRQSVEYIEKGGGTVALKDENQSLLYSSDQEENAMTVPITADMPIQDADSGFISGLIKKLFSK